MDASGIEPAPPLKVGGPAPDFVVTTVEPEGTASLADYRGTAPVMLVINRGLWCSFCRRHLAHLGTTRDRLRQLGVETLAIVAGEAHRTRLYVRHRPARVRLAADPALAVHRAYGLTMPPLTAEQQRVVDAMRFRLDEVALNPPDLSRLTAAAVRAAGDAPDTAVQQPLPLWDFIAVQRELYPYEMTEDEQREWTRWTRTRRLSTGQFLVDRAGLVRWMRIQHGHDPPAGFGNYPSDHELVTAARAVA